MTFPIFPDKHKLQPIVTAEQMVEFRRQQGGLKGQPAPHGVVLSLYSGVLKRLAWKYRSRHITAFQCDLYLLKKTRGRVGVLGNFGMGAPALVALAEQMSAWGTKRMITLSLAGGLQPDLKTGDIVLADGAIRDEGTSYHYLPPAQEVKASSALVASIARVLQSRGILHATGGVWSTDGAYRETHEEASYFQSRGVKAVDMESAGLFALGQVKAVETASILVVGQNLAAPRRIAPTEMGALHQRFKLLLDVLIEVLSES
jgi:uridine phosphorylase